MTHQAAGWCATSLMKWSVWLGNRWGLRRPGLAAMQVARISSKARQTDVPQSEISWGFPRTALWRSPAQSETSCWSKCEARETWCAGSTPQTAWRDVFIIGANAAHSEELDWPEPAWRFRIARGCCSGRTEWIPQRRRHPEFESSLRSDSLCLRSIAPT